MTRDQKDLVLRLMRKLEYDMRTTNLFHAKLASDAGIPIPVSGTLLDEWLDSLDCFHAYDLIHQLKADQ